MEERSMVAWAADSNSGLACNTSGERVPEEAQAGAEEWAPLNLLYSVPSGF